jgi:TolB-like protein
LLKTMSTLLLLAAALSTGCSRDRQYVRPNADFSTIQAVTVLPFENVTSDKLAAERVQRIFISELLNLNVFELVEPALAARLVGRDAFQASNVSPDEIKKLGKDLKVQGIFLGSLLEYDEGRGGAAANPRVTVQIRLVETETGATVWSITRTAGGASLGSRLFGMGGSTAVRAAEEAVREALAALKG